MFAFRLTDLPGHATPTEPPHTFVAADLRDSQQCRSLCDGVDTVIHLAGNPSPDASFDDVLETNMLASRNVFEAALETGCRRVVVASRAQVIEAYPVDQQIDHTKPVRPKNPYGVSKCFVEALGSYYGTQTSLSVIALRIGAFEFPEDHRLETMRDLSAFLSPRDACQLLERSILAEDIAFFIAHGISDNRFKRLDLSETIRTLGYRPQDDAFSLFAPAFSIER